MIRPGPAEIAPGTCPRGIVVHVYGLLSGLLYVDHVFTTSNLEEHVTATWAKVMPNLDLEESICLVCYDGDSGERMVPEGYVTGDRIN